MERRLQRLLIVLVIFFAVLFNQEARAAAPGTPVHIMNTLRDVFAKVINHAAFKVDAKKNMMDARFVPPAECLKLVNFVLNQPDEIVKEAGKYIKF